MHNQAPTSQGMLVRTATSHHRTSKANTSNGRRLSRSIMLATMKTCRVWATSAAWMALWYEFVALMSSVRVAIDQ